MDTKNVIKITVGGQNYTVITGERTGEAKALAADLDKKVTHILKENPNCTYTQAVVLAALDYAEKAKQAAESEEKLRGEIRSYLEDSAKAKTERDKANRELERLKTKLKKAHTSTPKSGLWGNAEE